MAHRKTAGRLADLSIASRPETRFRIRILDTFGERLRGLLGRRALAETEGVLLSPCRSIHTAFMRFPVDAVFLDANGTVLRVKSDLRPFRLAACATAASVAELSAGACARAGIRAGDRLLVSPVSGQNGNP
ncbi:MAG: DUF192 domain-containing protein [Planctomycetota bacterium]